MGNIRKRLRWPKSSLGPSELEVDDVYPLHMLDDTKGCRGFFLAWTLRFNDVLDARPLHESLSRLLEIGHWRKLGGRLRMNANGRLEYHVPKQFTSKRPAIAFSCDTSSSQMSIDEHPVASRLPRAMAEPFLQPASMHFRTFAARPDVPSSINEMIANDAPQLSLHVTSFNNATLVGISFPHTLMDAMGFETLLRSWSLVLAGREDEVPPILGARDDVLWASGAKYTGQNGEEDFILGRKILRGVSKLKFLLRLAWENFWNPDAETSILYLSNSAIAQLRHQAMGSIAVESKGELDKNNFISDGDILKAWVTQIIASSEPRPRPITILNAINARFRLASKLQAPGQGVYVQNMILVSFTCLSPQVARGPLGAVAAESRRQLAEQTTEQQMTMSLRLMRQKFESGQQPGFLAGATDSIPFVFNDLTKINIIGAADFKPAVLRQGDVAESRNNPIGTMVYHHFQNLNHIAFKVNFVVCLGKDHQGGGRWIMIRLTRKPLRAFKEAIKNM